jgi:hypothetical protein
MILRLSQKLAAKIKFGKLAELPLAENPLTDWSAHVFAAGRTQYIIVSNTATLYSMLLPGRGINDESELITRVFSNMADFLQEDGHALAYRRFIAPASGSVRFAKTLNRSVTGSMNELVRFATAWLSEDKTSPHEVGSRLNDVLLSALAPSKAIPYGKPREAFKELVGQLDS